MSIVIGTSFEPYSHFSWGKLGLKDVNSPRKAQSLELKCKTHSAILYSNYKSADKHMSLSQNFLQPTSRKQAFTHDDKAYEEQEGYTSTNALDNFIFSFSDQLQKNCSSPCENKKGGIIQETVMQLVLIRGSVICPF